MCKKKIMIDELPDPDLTPEEEAKVKLLTEKQIEDIDKAIISEVSHQWQKVAKIVGMTMLKLPSRVRGIPDLYYSQRVKKESIGVRPQFAHKRAG